MADIYLYYVLSVADNGGNMTGVDLDQHIPGLAEWRVKFAADPIAERVAADREANGEDFFNYLKRSM